MSKYLIKIDDEGYRNVLRIENETDTHITISNPLFVCWGSTFHSWGRTRTITKKWLEKRNFQEMDPTLARKYDNLKKDDSCTSLYD